MPTSNSSLIKMQNTFSFDSFLNIILLYFIYFLIKFHFLIILIAIEHFLYLFVKKYIGIIINNLIFLLKYI
jgi:hypothetical protein